MPLKLKTIASLIRETWAITQTNLLKKNLTYSSIFKAYFMKIFAAAKASLVFIKNRSRSSCSQMFFEVVVLKNFAIFTTLALESLFNKVAGLWVFSCEYYEIFENSFFYRTPPVAASADFLFYIIFSKRRC